MFYKTCWLQFREAADAGARLVSDQLNRNIYVYMHMYKTEKPHQFYNYENVYISRLHGFLLYISNNNEKITWNYSRYNQHLISHGWLI